MSRDWSLLDSECSGYLLDQPPAACDPAHTYDNVGPASTVGTAAGAVARCALYQQYPQYYHEGSPPALPPLPPPPTPYSASLTLPQLLRTKHPMITEQSVLKVDNPREIRNKAEKQRRDKLNQSISELASMVPPVVAASRKIDKTGVLRLTAHYLRAHQYVFGDSIGQTDPGINSATALTFLKMLDGFLLTTTYKGLVVVISQNVQQYLGYTELDLLGQNVLSIIHEDDRRIMREQLMPKLSLLGPNGELRVPDNADAKQRMADIFKKEKRRFVIRFKKLTQRSEAAQYVTCHVEGSLRKADRASLGYSRCCQMVRRARARGDTISSSGNDIVFVGLVRPCSETFLTEREMDSFTMEYRTRHSVDGEIIQCEQKISLVTGYMTHEVSGVNAMNFMHKDDVRWVIVALREMYDQRRLFGESCYRLMTKNGQFIYMKTRGRLEIDHSSQAVTTFVCTNTVVDEQEGKHLIDLMKKKFTLLVNNNQEMIEEEQDSTNDSHDVSVEDPRSLEKVILHLVTNLPSPDSGPDSPHSSASDENSSHSTERTRLSIIPPGKDRIVSAIDKIHSIIKTFDREPRVKLTEITEPTNEPQLPAQRESVLHVAKIKPEEGTVYQDMEPQTSDHVTWTSYEEPLPTLATFEESFVRNNVPEEFNKMSIVPKVADHVLAAVQLGEQEVDADICRHTVSMKRSGDYEDFGLSSKRKAFAVTAIRNGNCTNIKESSDELFEENSIDNLLDENGLDSQLNSALSLLNSMGTSNENSESFPDVLMGTEFQELFGSPERDPIKTNYSNDSPIE